MFNQWHIPPHEIDKSSCYLFIYFLIIRHTGWSLLFPSTAVVFVNIYVHHWLPWLVRITCCCGGSVWVASRRQLGVGGEGVGCCGHRWRSLLREFWRLFLGFQSVYERLDTTLHAGGHPAGHRVRRGRGGGGAGALGGRPCHQTLLIPQLRKKSTGLDGLLSPGFWVNIHHLIQENLQFLSVIKSQFYIWFVWKWMNLK